MSKVKRWEQEAVLWDTGTGEAGLQSLLTTRGEQGWELVSATSARPHAEAGQSSDLLLFFKRRRK